MHLRCAHFAFGRRSRDGDRNNAWNALWRDRGLRRRRGRCGAHAHRGRGAFDPASPAADRNPGVVEWFAALVAHSGARSHGLVRAQQNGACSSIIDARARLRSGSASAGGIWAQDSFPSHLTERAPHHYRRCYVGRGARDHTRGRAFVPGAGRSAAERELG